MFSLSKQNIHNFNRTRYKQKHLCNAPFTSISIGYDGQVSPCCYTLCPDKEIGNAFLKDNSLSEIWNGEVFNNYRKNIKRNLLPKSCNLCKEKLQHSEFSSVKILEYDHLQAQKKYPVLIELNIDNTCNLECVMCNSVNSSAIAAKNGINSRKLDTEMIFQQLIEFLPHVKEMIFSGGEPFMSKIYFRIWEKLIELNPECEITLNTNATVLNSHAKDIITRGKFNFNISLDSIEKETYEKIRVNSKFETFIENFYYLSAYSSSRDIPVSTPLCPLTYNYREIPEVVKFCNKNNAYIVFVHVFGAHNVALNASSYEILDDALKIYEKIDLPCDTNVAKHNSQKFKAFVSDVELWRANAIKREEFIQSLSINQKDFSKKDKILKERIDNILSEKKSQEKKSEKLDKVFEELPDYFKSDFFLNILNALPIETIISLLKSFPPVEIAEYFRMIFYQNTSQ